MPQPELREALAALLHEMWAGWLRYQFSKCVANADGSLTIPAAYVANLRRQMATPYAELSEYERNADRAEADRVLAVVEPELRQTNEALDWMSNLESIVTDAFARLVYATGNTSTVPHGYAFMRYDGRWVLSARTPPPWDETNCRICGWSVKATIEDGCTADSCSMRPLPAQRADGQPWNTKENDDATD